MISTFEEWAPRRRLRLPFCQQATSEFRRESLPGADCDVICARREDAMLRKPSCLLALVVLLCAIAQARVSAADGPPFIGRLPQGTVELVGITYHPEVVGITYDPPTKQSRWWQPDGSAAHLDLIPRQSKSRYETFRERERSRISRALREFASRRIAAGLGDQSLGRNVVSGSLELGMGTRFCPGSLRPDCLKLRDL